MDRQAVPSHPPYRLYVCPGSHFDLGWCLDPDGALAVSDLIIKDALDAILGPRPDFRFNIEYVEFVRHFLSAYPEYKASLARLLADRKVEICATSTGAMEQILDGEALVRQLVYGIRWLQRELNYTPVVAQHTDLPGHTLQLPQLLARCGIPYLVYSRYRPPQAVHYWTSPDGSRVVACNHIHHYNWGYAFRRDPQTCARRMQETLGKKFAAAWPTAQVLVPDEHDLDWADPTVGERIAAWNQAHADLGRAELAIVRDFFEALDIENLPAYQGEAPYGFYSIPAFEPETYRQARLAENALADAEKWAAVRQKLGLGHTPAETFEDGWRNLFWCHDHNIAGKDGAVNDAVRTHRAAHARIVAESVLREVNATILANLRPNLALGRPLVVLNALSWRRSGLVEATMELPDPKPAGVTIRTPDGTIIPSQLLSSERAGDGRIDYDLDDPSMYAHQVRFLFEARDVPPTGYRTFYIAHGEMPPSGRGWTATPDCLENEFFTVSLVNGGIVSILDRRTGRELADASCQNQLGTVTPFANVCALEDLRGNLEDGYDPWDKPGRAPNFTGRAWEAKPTGVVEVLESGPLRGRLRLYSELEENGVVQEIELSANRPRLSLTTTIDWRGTHHRQVRLRLPFALKDPTVSYETPFGRVVLGRDELPGSYAAQNVRWVQKWIDLTEPGFGITLSAGCCAVHFDRATVSPLLVSTTYCRGDAFYWMENQGIHSFRFDLETHSGDTIGSGAYRIGWEAWSPLRVARVQPRLVGVPHRAVLPETYSFVSCDDVRIVITAFLADEGEFLLRLFNTSDMPVHTALELAWDLKSAARCLMTGRPQASVTFHGRTVPVEVGPYEIQTLRLEFAG